MQLLVELAAATMLVADPRAVVTEHQIDFEGRRQRLIDAVVASEVEVSTMRYLLIFRRRVVMWRGRAYSTEGAALAAKRSELKRLRGSVLAEPLETRRSTLAPSADRPRSREVRRAVA